MTWDIILEIMFLLAAVTFVFLRLGVSKVPEVKPLSDSLPGTTPKPRDGKERELQAMDFRHAGDYDVSMMAGQSIKLRAYISPDGFHAAAFIDLTAGEDSVSVLEFSTLLEPSGSVTTSTGSHPRIFAHPPDRMLAQVPWMITSGEVFALHDVLCRTAMKEGRRLKQVTRLALPGSVRDLTRSSFEYQVERGRYKRVAADQYRMTMLGSLIAVPLVWYNMCFGFLFRWYHPGRTILCWKLRRGLRLADRLAKQAMEDIEEGNEQEGAWYMPNITFDGPRIEDVSKKRELIRSVSEAAAQAYGLPKQAIIVVIKENAPENVGVGGELLADRAMKTEPPKVGAGSG